MAGVAKLEDYRGDLQMHTQWSDGAGTIESMAAAAMARGDRYLCVTDHSYGLKIAMA
jgi:histidinol phosphatase-like PHP family hydrolase